MANVDGLEGFAGLGALRSLKLDLRYCTELANVDGLQSLLGLASLRSLALNIGDCSGLPGMLWLPGIAGLRSLESLTLNMKGSSDPVLQQLSTLEHVACESPEPS